MYILLYFRLFLNERCYFLNDEAISGGNRQAAN